MGVARAAVGDVRRFGAINWLGFWTLYEKEVRRFIKVYTQTLLAPMVTTLLYLSIFLLALGGAGRTAGGVGYGTFLAPGLMMMAMTQNAFANTSSSIVIAKVQGNIVDLLMPPLSPIEAVLALALGGATRGIVVGVAVALAVVPFVELPLHSLGLVLFHGFFASLMLSLLGIVGGIWSEKFDHIAAVTNFIVMPASFLSGTFYSVEALPEHWRFVAHLDPFFYMIDGFRAGFIGHADADPGLGMAVMLGLDAALLALAYVMFARGYKLKA
ncbi:transport permease protein [Aliidongia dinghuensis]|uniref:Transport permease protein n=1 Tax=Aliidongia dinghuensis TaxID=1867774 RepID=A0A8J3E7F8_9PROT|nr:transport permease protein [Aliidongia dinghuensis]